MNNKFTDRIKSNDKLMDLFKLFYSLVKETYPNLKTSNTKYYFAFKEFDNKNKIWISRNGENHLIIKVRKNTINNNDVRTFTITNKNQLISVWDTISESKELQIKNTEKMMLEIFSVELDEIIYSIKLEHLLKMFLINSDALNIVFSSGEIKIFEEYFFKGIDNTKNDEYLIDNLKVILRKISGIKEIISELDELNFILSKYPKAKTTSLLDLIYENNLYSEIDSKIYRKLVNILFKINDYNCKIK